MKELLHRSLLIVITQGFIRFALGVKLNGVSNHEIFLPQALNYKLIKVIDLIELKLPSHEKGFNDNQS